YIAGVEDGPRGWQPFGRAPGDGPFQFLMNIDLSMIIVVLGLVLGYVMFVAGILASPTSPGGKIASAALLTAGAFFILIHITSRAPEAQENGGRPQLRSRRQASTACILLLAGAGFFLYGLYGGVRLHTGRHWVGGVGLGLPSDVEIARDGVPHARPAGDPGT